MPIQYLHYISLHHYDHIYMYAIVKIRLKLPIVKILQPIIVVISANLSNGEG